MYWAENIENSTSVTELSNNQILENIAVIREKAEYFHSRELVRLERMKAKAIINNIELFESIREQYYTTKSTPPREWFINWGIYLSILKEAEKRNLLTKKKQIIT